MIARNAAKKTNNVVFSTRRKPAPAFPTPPEIPAALVAWRRHAPGRCVQVARGKVTLHSLDGVRRFDTIDAAVAAVRS